MKLNYEPIGKHIQLVDYRNSEEVTSTVLGISIDKEFMLTRLGLKYREYDFQQSEKAFEEEMRRQLGGNDNGELQ